MTDSIIDNIFQEATKRAHTRFWLISDLQQGVYERAERYVTIAVNDLNRIPGKLDGVCYLGDASEGTNIDTVNRMIDMQLEKLDSLGLPIYYTIGNHETEYCRFCRKNGDLTNGQIPFFDAVHNRPNWHLVKSQEDFWFSEEMSEYTMLFFSDHLAKDGSWIGFYEKLPKADSGYPYTKADWEAVRDRFAGDKPVFTFSHYAFPGGNRESEFLGQMLPLPKNFRAHFHGHAHIGDAVWAGKNLYRQIAAVDNHPIVQFDVSSLDHWRGTTVRSAFFDYYGNGEYGVFFRDHVNARWEQFFVSSHDARDACIPEQFSTASESLKPKA